MATTKSLARVFHGGMASIVAAAQAWREAVDRERQTKRVNLRGAAEQLSQLGEGVRGVVQTLCDAGHLQPDEADALVCASEAMKDAADKLERAAAR